MFHNLHPLLELVVGLELKVCSVVVLNSELRVLFLGDGLHHGGHLDTLSAMSVGDLMIRK